MTPQSVMDVAVTFAGPIDDSAYYFIAFNKNAGFTASVPVPVATGPFWGNGWGTGSISHFVQYRLGRYDVFTTNLTPVLRLAGGGITAVGGTPTGADSGRYDLRVGTLTPGAATVTGTGIITGATNTSGQNAGTLSLQTDAAGLTVAGAVTFTPATDGGHAPDAAQQAQLTALNAGGIALAHDALSAFGLDLTLGAAVAGTQTLSLAAASAPVTGKFVPFSSAAGHDVTGVLLANSTNASNPGTPIPGATITTGDLTEGGQARIDVEISQTPTLIGSPFAYTVPAGTSTLRFTLDLAQFGTGLSTLALNVISTTDLIFDPTVTDPALHCYDGLGPLGNDAVSFSTTEYRSYSNSTSFVPEQANDTTLQGRTTAARRHAVDIVDWTVAIRRLR